MRNAPWTVWRKRDLAYQIVIHLLAVVGAVALFTWATEARGLDRVWVVDDAWVLDNIERRVVPVATARRYYAF
ncbi:hypothetical protein IP78_13650 [Brevundimonas sp. AAP58]|nr:hypothetical protein IP78_13650 [Brevundimonas sp. AAP58]